MIPLLRSSLSSGQHHHQLSPRSKQNKKQNYSLLKICLTILTLSSLSIAATLTLSILQQDNPLQSFAIFPMSDDTTHEAPLLQPVDESAQLTITDTKPLVHFFNDYDGDDDDESTFPSSSSNSHLPSPRIVWLMSFPNSGTSFTLRLVHTVSNTSIASNYGGEDNHNLINNRNVLVNDAYPQGPFLHRIRKPLPSKYILTKTHCLGYCTNCPPRKEPLSEFQKGCCSGSGILPDPTRPKTKKPKSQRVTYSPTIVAKTIHLLRNPFDNVVSRFHLQHNRKSRAGDVAWLARHPRNATGFRQWCRGQDRIFRTRNDAAKNVPCHSEFYRYVQWHEGAYAVRQDLGLETMVVRYEDYHDNYRGTMGRILDFLELNETMTKPPFFWSDYSGYFRAKERRAVKGYIKDLATLDVLNLLRDYVQQEEE